MSLVHACRMMLRNVREGQQAAANSQGAMPEVSGVRLQTREALFQSRGKPFLAGFQQQDLPSLLLSDRKVGYLSRAAVDLAQDHSVKHQEDAPCHSALVGDEIPLEDAVETSVLALASENAHQADDAMAINDNTELLQSGYFSANGISIPSSEGAAGEADPVLTPEVLELKSSDFVHVHVSELDDHDFVIVLDEAF